MRNGQAIWYARRKVVENATMPEYEKPVKVVLRNNYFTCQPATAGGALAVFAYGENIYKTWTCTANARLFGDKIGEGDLFWVDGRKPESNTDDYSANAVVKTVSVSAFVMSIVLETNQNETDD
jgi:hypothetical protein